MESTQDLTESRLRIDLAACYRLVALHGWDDLVFTHISARVPSADGDGDAHHFLINPYGMLFEEITASSLVKVDAHGAKVSSSPYPVNPAGFVIHSAIHAARPDVVCVLHTHTPAGIAVSAQKDGLLPISQQATIALSSLGYHDYEGIALRDEEKPRLVRDLGKSTALVLRNHGLLTVGRSIADAFVAMFTLQRACEIQVLARAGGSQLVSVDAAVLAGVKSSAQAVVQDTMPQSKGPQARDGQTKESRGIGGEGDGRPKATAGSLAWPALLRKLDRLDPGYKI
ncbi:MAG TPA: class II aldolase/adducin family protein [Polyangiaceae bacterium]|jgi:ribulose-5-phosphate 4-epimerase/fuculose-1-phosphate aldolase|nr:class II aldolase/adducin family protein [Polyangiaceae bacterium]